MQPYSSYVFMEPVAETLLVPIEGKSRRRTVRGNNEYLDYAPLRIVTQSTMMPLADKAE